jgi:hypothetical protein
MHDIYFEQTEIELGLNQWQLNSWGRQKNCGSEHLVEMVQYVQIMCTTMSTEPACLPAGASQQWHPAERQTFTCLLALLLSSVVHSAHSERPAFQLPHCIHLFTHSPLPTVHYSLHTTFTALPDQSYHSSSTFSFTHCCKENYQEP